MHSHALLHLYQTPSKPTIIYTDAYYQIEGVHKRCFALIQLRPISDYDMLTVGRSARDLLRTKIAP